MQTIGTEGVDALRKKIEETTDAVGEVNAAFGRGEIDAKHYDAEMKRLAATQGSLRQTLDGIEKLGGNSKRSAQGLLDLGRAVQDFQAAGLGGILNNIEGLARGLGMGAGLAGVLTIVGVVIHSL